MFKMKSDRYGCEVCWPDDAGRAWEGVARWQVVSVIADDSHFIVKIRACPDCGQLFLTVFTERIDWVSGDDPQFWRIMPVSGTESHRIIGDFGFAARELSARRSLFRDYPSGETPKCFWGQGIAVATDAN